MRIASTIAVAILLMAAAACSGSDAGDGSGPVTLRLGFFPNVTHTQPLVGIANGIFEEQLGEGVRLEPMTFNAGPSVIEAMFAGQIDASYIGPNPAINGYVRSNGDVLRIVAGATSGGAQLIVRPESGINEISDLARKRIATPQLGNTQDVALRVFLLEHGLGARESGGNVEVLPIANPDILSLLQRGEIDGAWTVEPWTTRLIREAGGVVFLDERDLWPGGEFVTTHLIVRTRFLEQHPEVVERLVRAHVETTLWINENEEEAKGLVIDRIREISLAELPREVVDGAFANITITFDPVADSLRKSAADAYTLNYLDREPVLTNIYRLDILNAILAEKGLPIVGD